MAFETRPASLIGVWTTAYKVGEGRVGQSNVFGGETKQITLPESGLNVSVDRGSFPKNLLKRLFFGVGDVTVSIPGRSETYSNAFVAEEFRNAIYKEFERFAEERRDREWYKEAQLEDFAMMIPRPSMGITGIKGGAHLSRMQDRMEREAGDWVRKGEVVANVAGPVLAPCDGRIHHTTFAMAVPWWDETRNWPRKRNEYLISEVTDNVLFTIQPVKGQDISAAMVNAYSQYLIQAESAVHTARSMSPKEVSKNYSLRDGVTIQQFANVAMGQIEAMRNARPKFIPATPIHENDTRLTKDVLLRGNEAGRDSEQAPGQDIL